MPELRLCVQLQFFSFTCVRCNTAYITMFCFLQETLVLSDAQDRRRKWHEHVWDELVSVGSFLHVKAGWQRISHDIWGEVCLEVLAMILIVTFPDIWCLIIYVK